MNKRYLMGIYSQVRAPHLTVFQAACLNNTSTPKEEKGSFLAETVKVAGTF